MRNMRKLKAYFEKNAVHFRIIAVFCAVGAAVVILLATLFFGMFSKEIKSEIYRSQEESLQQIANTVQFRAEYVNSLLLQVKENRSVAKLFYSTDLGEIQTAFNDLRTIQASTRQFHSVYICSERSGKIYSLSDLIMPGASTIKAFWDQEFLDILENIEQFPKFTPVLRKISTMTPAGSQYDTYVYTYLLYDYNNSLPAGNVVAINMKLGWMQDALDFITSGQKTSKDIWIVNRDRQIVFTSSGDRIGQYGTVEELPDPIFEKETGYLILGEGANQKMLVYATPSTYADSGWTFLSWNDYSAVTQSLRESKISVYIICAGILFLSFWINVLCSYLIYRPVRRTFDRVEHLEGEQKKKKETDRMLFLRKLFLGVLPDDSLVIHENFEKYDIDCQLHQDVRVILVSIDFLDIYIKDYSRVLDETSRAVEEIIRQQMANFYQDFLCVRMQTGLWAIGVSAAENSEFSSLFAAVNKDLKDAMNLSVSMAASGTGRSVRDIPYLYSEALNVRSYRFLYGHERLITAEDIHDQTQVQFEYPSEIEKKLISSLFGGKLEETLNAYEEFVEAVCNFSVDGIRLAYLLLAYSIKNVSDRTIAEPTSIMVEYDKFYKKLQSMETIRGIHNMFRQLFEEITEKQQISSVERYEILIEQIKSFVHSNYGQSSLSMNEVADHVNLSSGYIGRLFKQITGSTFTDYLTKFRVEKACMLLREGDLSINEISDAVGFTNSSYFYAIFKKNLNCTPNQYRKQWNACDTRDE